MKRPKGFKSLLGNTSTNKTLNLKDLEDYLMGIFLNVPDQANVVIGQCLSLK